MRQYKKTDFKSIATWSGVPLNILPEFGLIEPGVAVGFLVETNTNYCLFEPFIANRETDPSVRDLAMYAIARGLLDTAKNRGYDMALCIVNHPNMIRRAHDLGFVDIVGEQKFLGKRL